MGGVFLESVLFLFQGKFPAPFTFFLTVAFASFVVCALICAFSTLVSKSFFPASYKLKPERKLLWHTTVVSLFPAFVVPILAIPSTFTFFQKYGFTLIGSADYEMWLALGLSLGYMAFDTTMMLAFWPTMRKAIIPSLFWQLMMHHIFSMLSWPFGMYTQCSVFPIGYFMCTEITNIFLNTRWFMVELNWPKGILDMLNGVCLLVAFVITRILPIPFVLYTLYDVVDKWNTFTFGQFIGISLIPIPLMLNVFWFKLLLRAAFKDRNRGGKKI